MSLTAGIALGVVLFALFAIVIVAAAPQPRSAGNSARKINERLEPAAHSSSELIVGAAYGPARELGRVGIVYRDASGTETSRVISIIRFENEWLEGHPEMIVAFCHLRGQLRTFRLSRVLNFFDPESGEVLSRVNLTANRNAEQLSAADAMAPPPVVFREPQTLSAALSELGPLLEAKGWIPLLTAGNAGSVLSLHRPKKRGVGALKRSAASLSFEPTTVARYGDETNGTPDLMRSNPWPWIVRAAGHTTTSYRSIEPAMMDFRHVAGLSGVEFVGGKGAMDSENVPS